MPGAVGVTLLGAVRVTVDGEPLALPPLARAALARLALSPGRVISTATLIAALWGPEPPASVRNRAHVTISMVRQALAAHGRAGIIATRPPGYLLSPDRADIDLVRFDADLARARQAIADGDDAAAVRQLTAALACWSAEPLGGIECAFADQARVELDERRQRAIEEKVRLQLRLCPADDLIAELTGLVTANPLRERLRGYLLTSLVRAGRQVEALDTYRAYASFLDEEYGLAPGAELRRLRDAALNQRAGPATDPPAPAVDALVVPAALPPDVPGFSGRADAVAQLDGILADAGPATTVRVAIVSGAPGVGKSALVVHWAHRVASRFPDGQLYLNLGGHGSGDPLTTPEAVRRLLDALGPPGPRGPSTTDGQIALYRSLLAGRRVLVVLDNARDTAQVQALLPGTPGCFVVVTARDQLTGLVASTGAEPVLLAPLTAEGSLDLLTARLPEADPGALEPVIRGCGGLPVALVVAAARVRLSPRSGLPAVAGQLGMAGHRLDALSHSDPTLDVRAVFSWSYQNLSPAAARLFRLLGGHPPAELSAPAAASIAGVPDVGRALGELTGASLLNEVAANRVHCHELLREYAAELSRTGDSGTDRRQAVRRMLDHYLHSAHRAALRLEPHREPMPLPELASGVSLAEPEDALEWFTAEYATLMSLVTVAATQGFVAHSRSLARTLTGLREWSRPSAEPQELLGH